MRAVTNALEVAWEGAHPDIPLTVATEASNVLAARIAEGAEADVFISADDIRPAELAEAGHTAGSPVPFAHNEIALVTGGATPIASAEDLAEPGTRLVVGGPSTPIGRYTDAAIAALATGTDDPAAFAAAVHGNIASREDNVRAALAKVELGEGDAAFVYRTDALGSEATTEVALPPAARIPADYSAVLVAERGAARRFIDWLRGPTAAAILADAGFEVAP